MSFITGDYPSSFGSEPQRALIYRGFVIGWRPGDANMSIYRNMADFNSIDACHYVSGGSSVAQEWIDRQPEARPISSRRERDNGYCDHL